MVTGLSSMSTAIAAMAESEHEAFPMFESNPTGTPAPSPFVATWPDSAPRAAAEYDGYTDEVACPMYLELIRMRLEHQYYRTVDVRCPKPTLRVQLS